MEQQDLGTMGIMEQLELPRFDLENMCVPTKVDQLIKPVIKHEIRLMELYKI